MSTEIILAAIRTTNWEQAKGLLKAMLHTYRSEYTENKFQAFAFDALLEEFIREVEDLGVQE